MTLTTTTSRADYNGNGSTTAFPVPFRFLQNADLRVIHKDGSGVETVLVINTDYTVAGAGAATGTVTLTTAPADGETLTILRVVTPLQATSFRNQGSFFPETHEDALDLLTMAAQQSDERETRTLKLPESISGATVDTTLPTPLPGAALAWNAAGDGLGNLLGESSGTVEDARDLTLADLASTADPAKGAALVGWKRSGGASRTVGDKLSDYITPEDYGAVGDGVADDAGPLAAAAAECADRGVVLRGAGDYLLGSTVSIRGVSVDFSAAKIRVSGGASLHLGGSASTTPNPPQDVYQIERVGGATSTPTCRICGTKNQDIRVGYCDYLQVYADSDNADDGSVAYCTWRFGYIQHLEITTNPTPVGSSVQWINENHCYFQRCGKLTISGTYPHNHNHFYGGTFEGATPPTSIKIDNGWDNQFHDCRFEVGGGDTVSIEFGANAQRNVFINTYDTSEGAYDDTSVDVIDNGVDNLVFDDWALYRHGATVAYADLNDVVLNTQVSEYIPRVPDLQRIYNNDNFGMICQSDYITVKSGDYFTWLTIDRNGSTTNDTDCLYRPRISFFDAGLNPVAASASFFVAKGSGFTAIGGNSAGQGSNAPGGSLRITRAAVDAGVRFVRVYWRNAISPTAGTSQAVAMSIIHHVADTRPYEGVAGQSRTTVGGGTLVSGVPTRGFAPVGWLCAKSDGSARYVNTFCHQTSLTSAASSGATVLPVVSTTSDGGYAVTAGDVVGVNLDDLSTHWTTVASLVPGVSVTVSSPLPSAAAAGKRLVFNRWVAV